MTDSNYDNIKRKCEFSIIWNYLGLVSNHLIGFGVSLYIARIIAPDDFAKIAIITILLGYSEQIADIGFRNALIQRRKAYDIQYNSIFYFNLGINIFIVVLVLLGAGYIAAWFGDNELALLAKVLSITLIFSACNYIPRTILERKLEFPLLARGNLLKALVKAGVVLPLVYFGYEIWGLVVSNLAASAAFTIFVWAKIDWRPALKWRWKAIAGVNRHGIKFWIAGLVRLFFDRVDQLIIGKYLGLAMLGQYSRAAGLKVMVDGVSNMGLNRMLLPVFSKFTNDPKTMQDIALKLFEASVLIIFTISGLLVITGEDLLIFCYTDKWGLAAKLFPLLMITSCCLPSYIVFNNVIASAKQTSKYLWLEILHKVLAFASLVSGVWCNCVYTYVYGLIVVSVLMNLLYVKFGGKIISVGSLRLTIIQIKYLLICIFSILVSNYIVFQDNGGWALMSKALFYLSVCIIANWILQTPGFRILFRRFLKLMKSIKGK